MVVGHYAMRQPQTMSAKHLDCSSRLAGFAACLLLMAPLAIAQQIPAPERRYSRFSEPDVKPEETEAVLETEIKTTITIPGVSFIPCQAEVVLAYSQRNTAARVKVDVSNSQCPAASGTFDIVASVRDEAGELTRLSFPEHFSLDEAGMFSFTRDYPIGENVTLSSVRSSRVECTCQVSDKSE